MTPEQAIEIQLVGEGGEPLPLSGVHFYLLFFTSGRWRYTFAVGPTDGSGKAAVDYATLENERVENGKTALMDYNTKLEDCDREVKIHVLTGEDLEKQLNSARMWYPNTIPEVESKIAHSNNLKIECEDVVVDLRDGMTKALVTCREIGDSILF